MQAPASLPLIDIHCHLIPGMDDGAQSWQETLAMARTAAADGVGTVVTTPHQLGNYPHNHGDQIRQATRELAEVLEAQRITLQVLPGADVRIEAELVARIRSGDVLTMADRGRHVLLELPHELYFHLQPVLEQLREEKIDGILSHPERNQGLLARPRLIEQLVDDGCLMQITAGSLTGAFGRHSQQLSRWMLQRGLVHFVASDAHAVRSRPPRLQRAFHDVRQRAGTDAALDLFCRNPAKVAAGDRVEGGRQAVAARGMLGWLGQTLGMRD